MASSGVHVEEHGAVRGGQTLKVHTPLQVPEEYEKEFKFIEDLALSEWELLELKVFVRCCGLKSP
eukprot:4449628-Amphidinium_carterae.1